VDTTKFWDNHQSQKIAGGINMIYQWNRHLSYMSLFQEQCKNVFIFSLPFFIFWDFGKLFSFPIFWLWWLSVVCPFVIFRLTFVLYVILLFTYSDYHFGIFKLFSLKHVIFSIQENKQRSTLKQTFILYVFISRAMQKCIHIFPTLFHFLRFR
jgi:hypothetical protein